MLMPKLSPNSGMTIDHDGSCGSRRLSVAANYHFHVFQYKKRLICSVTMIQ